VVETNYCITLDRVPETMYPEIAANEAQREEWVRLFAIDEIEATDGDLVNAATLAYSVPLTVDFLKQNPFLVLDTAFFSTDFKERLVDSIDGLDENMDGLMMHSENLQALELLRKKYSDKIQSIYIDPPYNTDATKILYKNGYENSSWCSLMQDRLFRGVSLLKQKGLICVTIDDYELYDLKHIIDGVMGDNLLATTAIRNNPSGRSTVLGFSVNHEYGLFYAKDKTQCIVGRLPHSDAQTARYGEQDEQGDCFEWENLRKNSSSSFRSDRPKQYYPIYVKQNSLDIRLPKMLWDELQRKWIVEEECFENEVAVYPIDDEGRERVWRFGIKRFVDEIGTIKATEKDRRIELYKRKYLQTAGVLPRTWWDKAEYSARDNGTRVLVNMFGADKSFDFPKAVAAVCDSIKITNTKSEDIVLDFFAGSGTTAHAVINLNREDGENRKYILVEMGEYFNTVTKPRVEKVIYSEDWKDGKPVSRKGSSHAFKYLRLESYEDTLNNIVLHGCNYDLLGDAREGYMLSYMLGTEVDGSASLLNVEKLDKPFSYKMNITRNLESAERAIDLVETFNYLIGLTVEKSHALVSYDADFATGEYGAVSAALKEGDTYKFKAVEGTVPSGDKTLVLWREMSGDIEKDNAALDAYFLSLPNAQSFRRVYVNCDNNLLNLRGNGESWQVILIDEEMKKRMFEDAK
jgi:adenine-specific DNA-methyltransferase